MCHGVALHRNQLLPSFGEWIDVIHGFSSQVHNVNIDISAFSCLCALILFRTNGKHSIRRRVSKIDSGLELKDSAKVEELRLKTLQSLHEHCATSSVASDRPNYLQKILAELPEIQKTAQPGAARLHCFKLDGLISPTPTLDRILMNVGTQVMQDEFNKLRQLSHESRKKIMISDTDTNGLSIACHS